MKLKDWDTIEVLTEYINDDITERKIQVDTKPQQKMECC